MITSVVTYAPTSKVLREGERDCDQEMINDFIQREDTAE